MTTDTNPTVDMAEPLTALFGKAEPRTVFSEPERVGDALVFTASAWERAGGFGFGAGSGSDETETGSGVGGGGGGSGQGRPVAVIRVTEGGIDVEPVIDVTKIGVTFLLAFVGVAGMWRRAR